ncbi:solute carrier family 22 member 7-like isoform X2 [Lineus longissimus]
MDTADQDTVDKDLLDMSEKSAVGTTVQFEDIFHHIGGLGRAQILIYLSAAIFECTCFQTMYYFIFENANPGYSCVEVIKDPGNLTDAIGPSDGNDFKNTTKLLQNGSYSGNVSFNSCPSAPFECSNLTFDTKYTSIVTEWTLICDQANIPRLITSMLFVGVLIGAFLGGALGDRFGRKRVLLVFWTCMMVSHALLSLMTSWQLYLCIRMVGGIFIGGTAVISSVLPMEYISSKYRTLAANRVGWQVGGFFLAMLAYCIRSWRYLAVAAGLFWLPALPFMIIFLPESARWLVQRGRIIEAKLWIDRIARLNGRPPFDSAQLLAAIAQEEASSRDLAQKYTYIDLFRTKKYAGMTVTMMFGWFSTALITYGVTSNLASFAGNLYLKLTIFAVLKLGTRWTIVFMANIIGRRKSFILYMSIPVSCMFAIMALDITNYNESYQIAITALALLSYTGLDGAWGLQFMFSTEAFPTVVR